MAGIWQEVKNEKIGGVVLLLICMRVNSQDFSLKGMDGL
jgi:hypothetical protein